MEDVYEFVRMDFSNPIEMDKLVRLQNKVYEGIHIFTDKLFKYWYLDNPNGKVISFNALSDGEIASHYAVIPIKMEISGRVVKGALSMATVTHPNHRGKGLFKKLAQKTYECAKEEGLEFIIGVANANSYPGFIKHLGFYEVKQLDVLIGVKDNIQPNDKKTFQVYYDNDILKWRINREEDYRIRGNHVFGFYPFWKFKRCPLLHTYMGTISPELSPSLSLKKSSTLIHPFNLYVGIGSNAKQLGYHKVPSFIKHSPFHLIFLDLTEGVLPKMNKDNVFFQLMDFDVA